MTFWDLINATFDRVKEPLSPKEIWTKAANYGITNDFETSGKTPWATIGAYLYTEINNNGDDSKYIQISERPARFIPRQLSTELDIDKVSSLKQKEDESVEQLKARKKKFSERDLHPLMVAFAKTDTHFKAYLKTIFHESSKRTKKGLNEWLHPDLVGVYFPFRDYSSETVEIQRELSISSVKLFSFELKTNLTFGNLREYYFQAVSNSSWANEGYLVTLNLQDDSTLLDEIRRLNNAFGIGLIKLNAENVYESQILFPSKEKPEIDWDTVNRLAKENGDFSVFLKDMSEDIKLGKVKSTYDKVLSPENLEKFIRDKEIQNN
ncbi:hypothetical protein PEPS_47350 (plasmid) [Persicobacter psychrovividus]|uniref:HTH HARE-type domain-containing protein n=2 Tax=Persicobacter psychrovividus TaxID=387638 RepID=A0ABM7VN65_9BACT|nr:hypothetical protein PEPS_47350 [Persicobacter psychrovividus]